MKKISCIPLVLMLLSCSQENVRNSNVRIDLLDDFRYARQSNEGGRKFTIFSTGETYIRNKKKKALIQHSSGRIIFFVKFGVDPALKLLPMTKEHSQDVHGSVTIRSDYPSALEQSVSVRWNRPLELSVPAFAGRTAMVELSVASNRRGRWKHPIYWIEPAIEEEISAPNDAPSRATSEAFLKRHRNDNLLLIVFDAATASHFGCYGYSKKTTPFVDAFASESVVWESAFTQAVYTIASTGTLLTGLYPNVHRVVGHGMALNEKYKTMPESLREGGIHTALFTANTNASPMAGYGQGFDTVWMPKDNFIRANDFVEPVKQWLDSNRNRRYFGYIHFREPHYPFSSPPEYLKTFETDLNFQLPITNNKLQRDAEERRKITAAYDANLAFVDREFGKILKHLKETGLLKKTIVMLLSDHGEAFWEHRLQGHNYSLYDEVMRIPLIIHFPGEEGLRGVRRKQPAGTVQIFPTVAELFELSTKSLRWSSSSLLPLILADSATGDEFVFSQTAEQKGYASRTGDFKYIRAPKKEYDEFYILKEDPHETKNRIRDYPILAGYHRLALDKALRKMRVSAEKLPSPEKVVIDKESEEQLRALGYIQ